MQEWDGLAAGRFRESFVNQIPVVTGSQVSLTVAMQSVADACQVVYGCAREDLKEVAKGTRDALDFHRPSGGSAVPIVLSTLAAGTAVAAGCFGGPGELRSRCQPCPLARASSRTRSNQPRSPRRT